LFSRHARGHGIHSPFIYNFIINVLKEKEFPKELEEIEKIRSNLYRSDEFILMNDLGTDQEDGNPLKKSVARIARMAATRRKYGRLLFQILKYYKPAKVLELGTSLGIGSMYLGMGNSDSEIITIEGCKACVDIARRHIKKVGLTNVNVMNGALKDVLPLTLKEMEWIDLIFFDGDHRKIPLIDYFKTALPYMRNDTIFIFDDIHWSAEMENAWEFIKNHSQVKVTLDLYQFGIVFFRKELQKQDFLVRFL
jgi:predicted O-methyltransferase YrrM